MLLVPGWQKVTSSSLNLNGIQQSYPDHLQQIWDLGWYLHDLREVYQESPVFLIKQVLSERGVIEAAPCTVEGEESGEQLDRLKSLMERHGDYP